MNIEKHQDVLNTSVNDIILLLNQNHSDFDSVNIDSNLAINDEDFLELANEANNNKLISQSVVNLIAEFIGLMACHQQMVNKVLELESLLYECLANDYITDVQFSDDTLKKYQTLLAKQRLIVNNDKAILDKKNNHPLEIFKAGYQEGYMKRFNDIFFDINSLKLNGDEETAFLKLFTISKIVLDNTKSSVLLVKGNVKELIFDNKPNSTVH